MESRKAFDSLYEIAEKAVGSDPHKVDEKRSMLQKALDFYERAVNEEGEDDPSMKLGQARAYLCIGKIRHQLGDFPNVPKAFERARQILEPLVRDPQSSVEFARLLGDCTNAEGIYAMQLGRTDDATRLFRRAVELQEAILRNDTEDERARFALSRHTSNLGAVFIEEHKFDSARQMLETSLQHLERYFASKKEPSTGDRRQMALIHHNLGVVHHRMDQFELAQRHWNEEFSISEQLVKEHPFDPQLLDSLASSTLSMGVLCYDSDKFAEAEKYFGEAQRNYAKLLGPYPNIPAYRSEHGRSTHGLARSLKEQGKLGEARQVLEGGEALLEKLSVDFPDAVAYRIDLLKSRIDHANLLADAGELSEATAIAEKAWRETAEGDNRLKPKPDVQSHWLKLRNNLADYAWRAGQREEAVKGFYAAIAIGEQLAADHPTALDYRATLAGVRANTARLLHQLGRNDEAQVIVQKMLADYAELAAAEPGKSRWTINKTWALVRQAQVCPERNNEKAVSRIWTEAVATANRLVDDFGDQPTAVAAAAWFFALCPSKCACNPKKAIELAKLANRLAPDSPEAARALGLAQLRAGDGTAAVDTLLRARRLFKQRDRLTDLILALAYDEAGKPNTARREYTQACKLLDESREHSEDLDRLRAEADRRFAKRGV
jgi:tetratricopeptide (TPR) repeat protein